MFLKDKTKLTISFIVLTSFVLLALFGLFTIMPMNMNADINTVDISHCPYMEGGYSMCPINSFNNIEAWQNTLRAIPIKNILSLILLSLIFVFFIFLNVKRVRWLYEKYTCTKIRLYKKLIVNYPIPLFVFLFSQGILNSKSY